MTITYGASDLTVQTCNRRTPMVSAGPLLVTSGGQRCSLNLCTLQERPAVLTSSGEACTVGASWWYASDWNAFLC